MLIGHRGAPGYRPEHTASSYRLAFEQSVDAVEPDIVVSSDGVLVIRHENEISGTTDVAEHPEFAERRTTKTVDGETLTGWFVEDFTWAELRTLRCRERLPEVRPGSARYDGEEPMLRLEELLALVDEANDERAEGRAPIGLVIELKHVQFLLDCAGAPASRGGAARSLDPIPLLIEALRRSGWGERESQLTIECFELAPLERLREAGLPAKYVFLLETEGSPSDELETHGDAARSFAWYRSDEGLDSLVGRVHGISVAKGDLLSCDEDRGRCEPNDLVRRAHARALSVFTWTLRPENTFLAPVFRRGSDRAHYGDWPAEWRAILASGVDGVFLDHPDLLASLSSEAGRV